VGLFQLHSLSPPIREKVVLPTQPHPPQVALQELVPLPPSQSQDLTNGTSYTFTVTALSSSGVSTSSSASSSVTPAIPKAGYFARSSSTTTIDKLTFSNETVATSGQPTFQYPTYECSSFANSGTAGYFMGGTGGPSSNPYQTAIFKIPFATDVRETISATLSQGTNEQAGMANSGTAGYGLGGQITGGPKTGRIEKLAFSNDSRSTLGSNLPTDIGDGAGFANSGTAGYHAGGVPGFGTSSTCYKVTFSNDSVSTVSNRMTYDVQAAIGFANSGTAGYSIGGAGSAGFNTTGKVRQKLPFSNETWSALTFFLDVNAANGAGCSNNGIAGYLSGGQSVSTLVKMTFSTDTSSSAISAKLTGTLSQGASFANSGTL
jgi:hypothetical protein